MAKTTDKETQRKTPATYADGRPFDTLHYLQAKLLLKPDRLSSAERFRAFGDLTRRTTKASGVGFIEDPDTDDRPRVREVVFVDTPDFRLYKSGFILRRRIRYVDGFPKGDPEIVFKLRHPDMATAAARDVRPLIAGKFQIKFKVQALPLNDRLGGYRTLYSHNCQFGLSQVEEKDRLAMSTLTRIFPALAAVKHPAHGRVQLVNESIVEELLLPLGKLDFGHGIVAKSDIALWRTRGDHQPVIGEYAFQFKFDRLEDIPAKTEKRVKAFFVTLQHDVRDWISLGTTKTGLVYRLKGGTPGRHE